MKKQILLAFLKIHKPDVLTLIPKQWSVDEVRALVTSYVAVYQKNNVTLLELLKDYQCKICFIYKNVYLIVTNNDKHIWTHFQNKCLWTEQQLFSFVRKRKVRLRAFLKLQLHHHGCFSTVSTNLNTQLCSVLEYSQDDIMNFFYRLRSLPQKFHLMSLCTVFVNWFQKSSCRSPKVLIDHSVFCVLQRRSSVEPTGGHRGAALRGSE